MISYHVFFTPKPSVDEHVLIAVAHRFFRSLEAAKKLKTHRILRVTNPASFQALPRFRAIADYESQQELDESLAFMRQPQKKEDGPHGELMRMSPISKSALRPMFNLELNGSLTPAAATGRVSS